MLAESEQRAWNEIERTSTQDSRGSNGIRALAVGAVGLAIMFVVIGAPVAGLVVLAVPALGWVLSRYWQDVGRACEAAVVPVDGWVADGAFPHHRQQTPGRTTRSGDPCDDLEVVQAIGPTQVRRRP